MLDPASHEATVEHHFKSFFATIFDTEGDVLLANVVHFAPRGIGLAFLHLGIEHDRGIRKCAERELVGKEAAEVIRQKGLDTAHTSLVGIDVCGDIISIVRAGQDQIFVVGVEIGYVGLDPAACIAVSDTEVPGHGLFGFQVRIAYGRAERAYVLACFLESIGSTECTTECTMSCKAFHKLIFDSDIRIDYVMSFLFGFIVEILVRFQVKEHEVGTCTGRYR